MKRGSTHSEAQASGRSLDPIVGQYAIVNGIGDLAMDGDKRAFIGETVFVERKTKSGMYVVMKHDGVKCVLPKRNLDMPNVTGQGTRHLVAGTLDPLVGILIIVPIMFYFKSQICTHWAKHFSLHLCR